MRHRTAILCCAAIAALAWLAALNLAAKCAILATLDRQANAAGTKLVAFFEERYASVPRLVGGAVAFLGQEDDATRALVAAHDRFVGAHGVEAKATAALGIEQALRDLLLEQLREHRGMTSNYDFIVARRSFQITTANMQPAIRAYNAAAARFLAYASRFPNDRIAGMLGMQHTLFRLPRPAAAGGGSRDHSSGVSKEGTVNSMSK
jgi:hypothetical protein